MNRNRFYGNYIGTTLGICLAYGIINHSLKVASLTFLSSLVVLFISSPIALYLRFLDQNLPRPLIHIFTIAMCIFMIIGAYSTLHERNPFHIVLTYSVLAGAIFVGWFCWRFTRSTDNHGAA